MSTAECIHCGWFGDITRYCPHCGRRVKTSEDDDYRRDKYETEKEEEEEE